MAAFPSPQRESFLDTRTQQVLNQRGKELIGLGLIGLGLVFALILGSYSPQDPSWMAATDDPVHNALGRLGAGLASPLVVIMGYASWGIVLACVVWGLRLVTHRGEETILARSVLVPIAVAVAAFWLATLVPGEGWTADDGLGGMFGDTIAGAVLTALPLTSSFSLNLLTLLTFAMTLAVWLYVLGSSGAEVRRLGRFLVLGVVMTYAGLMSLLGMSARGVGQIATRGQQRLSARRETRVQARAAAQAMAVQHPVEPAPAWADQPAWGDQYASGDWEPEPYVGHPEPVEQPAPRRASAPVIHRPASSPRVEPVLHADQPAYEPQLSRSAPPRPSHAQMQPAAPRPTPAQPVTPLAPERQGLLARVSALGRRRSEDEAWSSQDGAFVETPMPEHLVDAPPPSKEHIRSRISDVIRTRRVAKPVLRFDPEAQPSVAERAPAQDIAVEPPMTAQPDHAHSDRDAPAPAQAAPALGYTHSFGFAAGQMAYPGVLPLQGGTDETDVLEPYDGYETDCHDDLRDPYAPVEAPVAAPAPQAAPRGVLNRRVVQTPSRRKSAPSRQAEAEAQPALPFEPKQSAFELPPLSLLQDTSRVQQVTLSNEALEENARMLESVLEDYGVRGEIVSVRPGPVVTMYELEPAPGLKASRVIGLSDDIARSMSALSARVSTVPGRSVIGIELPNQTREKVVLREILSSREFGDGNQTLPLALGKDIGGEGVVANLAKMPHLLIAGTTGSGKSVAINTMILSLLYKLTPEECRMIMIDPKMLELSVYDGIPHLLSPVVTDPKKAVVALKWVVGEMEDRYRKMSKMGVRNIEGYNGRVNEALAKGESFKRTVQTGFDDETGDPVFESEEFAPEVLPYIVVVVDEMADLMMTAGKEVEACIQRIAQKARASGIHLIMATQRPSVDVITGTIKANFPARISFQVTSKIDSRTILGEMGAEQLLGMGDMLYMPNGSRLQRVHGPFVSDEEVEEVVNHLKSFGPAEYVGSVVEGPDSETGADIDAVLGLGDSGGEDQLYDQAVAIVARDRKCSTSYIQRKLAIGYNKAARLVEQMEDQGVVSSANHVGKREILIPEGQ